MAKKKSGLNLGKILYLVAAALGVVAVVMMFVDTIKIPDTKILGETIEGEGFSGLKVAFGYKEEDMAIFKFSFMGLLPYVFVIAGAVLAVVNAVAKKNNKILDYVAIALFVVSGVLFFCMPNFVVFADTLAGKVAAEFDYELAVGAIVSAISAVASGAVIITKVLLKK